MAKFSISKLEAARRNPKQFALDLQNEAKGFPVKSMFMDWQRAINNFHNNQNENEANKYLTNAFKNHFADNSVKTQKLEEHILKFENYIQDTNKKKLYFNEKLKRLSIQVSPTLLMTGLIPLIYLNSSSGYTAKSLYGCSISDIEVGVYSFENDEHEFHKYSQREITKALSELTDLGNNISSFL